MKKIFSCLLFLSLFTMGRAQTDRGDWMVGGNFRLNTSDNNTEISLTPNAGVFIINNLALGGNVELAYAKSGNVKASSFGIGPFLRYYFTKASVRPILQGNFNFSSVKTKIAGLPSNTDNGINFFLGGGAAIFISDQVSIDGLMGYYHSKYSDSDGSGGFALTIGFQVYLLKNQVDKVRGR